MSDESGLETPGSVKSIWPAVVILGFAAAIYIVAQGYSETARRFPSMVAISLMVLGAIDLYSRTGLPGRDAVNAFWGSGFDRREMVKVPPLGKELALFAWIAAAFLGMAIFGILIAAPLFVFLYVWRRSGRSVVMAFAAGFIVFAFEYAVFEWALDYTLYRGLILNGEGFSAW